jgi:hypothetical protein
MKHVVDVAFRLNWQGIEFDDDNDILFFDVCPFAISFMGYKCRKFLFIFLFPAVLSISWSVK